MPMSTNNKRQKNTPVSKVANQSHHLSNGLDVEVLRKETDFARYLEALKSFANKYTVLITAIDTPIGSHFTQTMAIKLHELGLMPFSAQMYRKSYVAVIHKGKKLFEKVGRDDMERANYDGVIDGVPVNIKSMGFSNGELSRTNKSTLGIFIDNEKQIPEERGMHIVLFDTKENSILDVCNFDSFAQTRCFHYGGVTLDSLKQDFLNWANLHPRISILSCNTPVFPTQNLTENEQHIIDDDIDVLRIVQNIHNPQYSILHKYVEYPNEIIDLLYRHEAELDLYGVPQFKDKSSRLFNCRNGLRVTTDQPVEHRRTLYYVGPSYAVGCGSSDRGTIASNLQRLFSTLAPEQGIIVQNYSCYYQKGAGSNKFLLLKKIQSMPVTHGDIVLVHERAVSDCEGVPLINISDLFQRPHNYGEVYCDKVHFTEDGNKVIADKIFEYLKAENFYSDKVVSQVAPITIPSNNLELPAEAAEKLQNYKKILTDFYNEMFPRPKIGAIVMNCNPFTLGHRYLIEQAAKQVSHLMVFVVQEDRSFFPFDDRLALVDAGTADLPNITVIPSGPFIISSLTFTEYFNKSELQDRVIDSSVDVNLFGQEIAPCLDIKVRFIGNEPFDMVTNQYNETMKAVLPKYGIGVVEIPRFEQDGEAVSASKVRELLEKRDWDLIEKFVPKSTFDYLREHFV